MNSNTTIDLHQIAAAERPALVLARFEALPVGGWLDLAIDAQDLAALGLLLEAQWPGQFDWQALAGERLRLSRKPAAKSGCCGCCGGGGGPKSNAVA